jgi:transcriptional regulator with XRE-family HTH domain
MDIKTYLKATGLTYAEFGARIGAPGGAPGGVSGGVSAGMVGHWIAGRHRITAERAIQIEAATDGAVTRAELRPDLFGGPAPA